MFNTHSHLNDDAFKEDLNDVVTRSKEYGVTNILVNSWDLKSSKLALDISEKYDFIYAAIGFHPENIADLDIKDLETIKPLLKHCKVVAIGEIGLDYYWDKKNETKTKQKDFFIKQIEIANEYNLPICIHCRDAIEDTLNILKKHPVKKGGVMHCYSGSVESMKEFVKLGFEIQYQSMDLSRVARIRSEYHDEMGDSLYRMKIIDYNDLLFWKKNMEERVNTPLFNPQLYHALCSEIEKREQAKLNKDEAMNKIMLFIEALKKQYGEDVIDECLNDMSMKGTKII